MSDEFGNYCPAEWSKTGQKYPHFTDYYRILGKMVEILKKLVYNDADLKSRGASYAAKTK